MKNVVITGITSKSGRYLLQELNRHVAQFAEWQFRFSARESSDLSILDNCELNYEIAVGSLSEESYTDALFHFDEGETVLLNISGIWCSERLVRSAIKNGVTELILVHTTGIYSKFKSAGEEYLRTETAIRGLLESHPEVSLTILRPTMVYGTLRDNNVSVFIRMIDRFPIIPTINGAKYPLQPIWCGDLGKGYYLALLQEKQPGEKEYILSGAEPILLIDMYHVIEAYLGKKRHYLYVPYGLAYLGAWGLYLLTGKRRDYRERVQRMVEPRAYSHELAARELGFCPLDFKDGVEEEISMYMREKN